MILFTWWVNFQLHCSDWVSITFYIKHEQWLIDFTQKENISLTQTRHYFSHCDIKFIISLCFDDRAKYKKSKIFTSYSSIWTATMNEISMSCSFWPWSWIKEHKCVTRHEGWTVKNMKIVHNFKEQWSDWDVSYVHGYHLLF